MTVANTNVSSSYNANGETREWNLGFSYNSTLSGLSIVVTHSDGSSTTVTSNYELDGTVLTYPTVESELDPLPVGDVITITRVTPITQAINLTQQGPLDSEVLESGFDKNTLISQEIANRLNLVPSQQTINDSIAAHNSSNTSHTDIRTLANNAMPKSGGTFTGSVYMANGTSINFPNYKIGENGSGNAIIGDNNGNGLVILPNGEGAALFTNGGSEYSELVRFKDVKSTYSSSSTYPIDGVAVAQAVSTKQDTLSASQLLAVNSGIDSTKVSQIATNASAISNETTNRQNGDIALQGQIDALKAASDVADVVADYTALQNYDTSKLTDKALIKVLLDSTHNNAETYYRWSTSTSSFSYVGSAGASYTKSESDAKFLSQTSAASTYETISNVTTGLAGKASNADNTSIVDNGTTITTVGIKEQNASAVIKKWYGTKAQLDAISTKDSNTEYGTTDENDGQPIVIDNVLSNSENPVQNKVIKAALDAKQATITGAASSITSSNLTASKALASDASGKVVASSVTATELGYVSGVTSAIQTQLNAKQPTLPAGTTGYYLQKTADGVTWAAVSGGGSVTVDGTTIDDTNDILSAIGLKETRNSDAIKLWVGTVAQYNAISTKDSNTLYVKKDVPTYYQTVSNLVTSVSSSSTDAQYPSAKLFYDTCGDIETLINAL